jgi:hypothetical protein
MKGDLIVFEVFALLKKNKKLKFYNFRYKILDIKLGADPIIS